MSKPITAAQKRAAGRIVAERRQAKSAATEANKRLGLPRGTAQMLQRVKDPEFMIALEEAQKLLAAGWSQVGATALQELHRRMDDPAYLQKMPDMVLAKIASLGVQRAGDVDDRLRVQDGSGKTYEVVEGVMKV